MTLTSAADHVIAKRQDGHFIAGLTRHFDIDDE